jgi:hypothetical protein
MAGLKISELSSSLAPSLTGVTPVVLGSTTYKSTLQSLRQVLVDSGSHVFTGSQVIKGDLTISGSITAQQYILSSSITNITTETISGSSNFGNSLDDDHKFTGSVLITGSLRANNIQDNGNLYVSGFVVIGDKMPINSPDTPKFHLTNSGSFNITHFEANNEYYAQVNITNINSGSLASSDLVLTADNGNETVHFVNLGINSSTYNGGYVGYENDAYLLNVGKDLYIGTVGGTSHPAELKLFANNSWENPQITVHTGSEISFNTSSVTEGYSYEFSGNVKLQDELSVNGSITASYFVGDGSQLTNLPIPTIDTSSLATTGSNIFIGNQIVTGSLSFGDGGAIQSISSSSGDGGGYSTLTLTPDSSLGSDQYIILDPTGPNHIHIRPGGTIDNSGADLYIGGEKNYVRVNNSTPSVRMQTESTTTLNSYYFTPGFGAASIEWYTVSGNHYVRFNDPTMDVYNAIWAFNSPSTFTATYNSGNDYISFTVNGSSTPGFPQAPSFYVAEAPPSSPTYLDYADIQILQNRQTYIETNGSDVRIDAADDLRLYSRDRFQLINYSPDEAVEIHLDYNNTDKIFSFNPNGSLGFPDGTSQNTAFVTSSIAGFAITGSNTFIDNQTISGSKYLAVETIQNLSGSLNLITAGGSVEILSSNLNVLNGGIVTNYNVSASSLTGSIDYSNLTNVPIPTLISSGPTAPGSAVVANDTDVDINYSGYGTRWTFTITGLTFPDSTIQTTAFTGFPSGTVSGSSQIQYSGLTGIPLGIISGSSQILDGSGIWSGSAQLPSGIISGSSQLPSGLVSGSSQISYTGITDTPNGLISGSSQISNLGYAITGSNTFIGEQTINGSLIIEGVSEVITVDGGFNGNRTFDYTSGSIFYLTGLTGNGIWNVNNVPTTNNRTLTLTYVIEQGVTPYSGSQYQINGSNVTIKWVDNTIPTGSANNTEVIGLTAFRVGSSWNVIGSLSTFGV